VSRLAVTRDAEESVSRTRLWVRRTAGLALEPLSRMPPKDMALSLVLGVAFGVFPAPACPTLLCAMAAFALRLNPSAIQAVNYLVSPLQIALAAPLVRLGKRLFHDSGAATTGAAIPVNAVWRAAHAIWIASAHAIAAWFCVCAPLGLLLYALLAFALRKRMERSLAAPGGAGWAGLYAET
jgi:hypothetical protein